MIEIDKNVGKGDLVYAWFTQSKDKAKKPDEREYRVGDVGKDVLKIESMEGGYSIIFGRELLETWYGRVRRVKA